MAHEIVIPRLGWSMEEGSFVRWLKADGDPVARGEAIFELEGEKALQEIEAVNEGILHIPPFGPKPGEVLRVGAVIGYLKAAEESISNLTVNSSAHAFVALSLESNIAKHPKSPTLIQPSSNGVVVSPRARRVAKELGIDWTQLSGTGMGGRVRECDVRSAFEHQRLSGVPSDIALRIPHSNRRRLIAKRMATAQQRTVPVTLTTKADATRLVKLRELFKAQANPSEAPGYQDIIAKLVAETLKRNLLLTGQWEEDEIVLAAQNALHIGIAVDTGEGLVVPVIQNVGGLTLIDLAGQTRQLIKRARSWTLSAADMQGGVFTITNLGSFGIDAFTPVINPPQSCILGLGAIRLEPVALDDGQIAARHQITLSLTFDHRVIDGAPAARFLQSLVDAIANLSIGLLTQ